MLPKQMREAVGAARRPEHPGRSVARRGRASHDRPVRVAMRTLIVSDLHLGSAPRSTCCAAPSCARRCCEALRGRRSRWCCSATCSSCATARRATRWRRRGRSSKISGARSPGASSWSSPATTTTRWSSRGWRARAGGTHRSRSGSSRLLEPSEASPMLARIAEWAAPARVQRRLPGPVGAPRRLRHPRPLPGLPSDRAHARAAERRRDEPRAAAPGRARSAASRTTRRSRRRCSPGGTRSPGTRAPAAR